MYKRILQTKIRESLKKYPTITLLGPRQSGKTTLLKTCFPNYTYINLEDPSVRDRAIKDPKGLLAQSTDPMILDEIQRVPDLLSHIQVLVDSTKRKFILTGSHQLLLFEKITQTLAGRSRIFELLPLSAEEIFEKEKKIDLDRLILSGGYPRIYNEKHDPFEWLNQYLQTYVERDVRQILNVSDLNQFERFLKILAGRVGQISNYSSIGQDVGIKSATANAWVSLLSASFITFLLPPYFQNFNKRFIKSPKIYFVDTGLLCALLGIKNREHLRSHPLIGFIFENFIISEMLKKALNRGEKSSLYFYRDQKQVEVDLIHEDGPLVNMFEIKWGQTFQTDWTKGLEFLKRNENKKSKSQVIYTGNENLVFHDCLVDNWKSFIL